MFCECAQIILIFGCVYLRLSRLMANHAGNNSEGKCFGDLMVVPYHLEGSLVATNCFSMFSNLGMKVTFALCIC